MCSLTNASRTSNPVKLTSTGYAPLATDFSRVDGEKAKGPRGIIHRPPSSAAAVTSLAFFAQRVCVCGRARARESGLGYFPIIQT